MVRKHQTDITAHKAIRLGLWLRNRKTGVRLASLLLAVLMAAGTYTEIANLFIIPGSYSLSGEARKLLSTPTGYLATSLKYDPGSATYHYNQGYVPGGDTAGQSVNPRFSASFKGSDDHAVTITDPVTKASVSIKSKFSLKQPKQSQNQLIYPLETRNAVKVVSLATVGFKEDIVLNQFQGDKLEFKYELSLSDGTEARLEPDGSLAIYGADYNLLGDVSVGSDSDQQLLDTARKNAVKRNLLFTFPAPFIKEYGKRTINNNAWFTLNGNELTLHASNLASATYPLTIDPSVYVETAAKLMRGNNETNVDFDIDNELIQKSQTTGARIDAWQGNLDMNEGIWDSGTAAAGGYVYRAGGRTGLSKPQVVTQQVTTESTNDATFAMDMPSSRPAGDLYVALICHDNATATVTAPTGWTEYADVGEHSAYYKVGTDAGGGNEAANYTFTISGNESKAGVIVRITGFNPDDPVSGTPGTGSSASNTEPIFPAVTSDSGATLVIRAAGADNDIPTDTGWVPAGHTKIASGTSGGTQDCGFVAASLDTPPQSGVSTGTQQIDDSSLNDTWGASSIAINPIGTIPPPQIEDQQQSLQSSSSGSFAMDMPSSRPAGDLYVALICHDGTGTVAPPSGWTEYADIREHAAYYKVGTDQGGGNEAANYTWNLDSGSEIWAGVIVRVSNFDSSDPVSGTPGTGSSGGNNIPVFPATTPDNNNSLVIRAAGADNDTPSATGWVPSGHTKIASGTPGVFGDCGYVAAAMDNAPAAGVSTGTQQLGDSSLNDTYGSSTIAINPAPASGASESVRASVNWAKFNSSSLAIESPNPGAGVCSGWCTDPTYDLPAGRRGHSMLAYNGYLYVMGGVGSDGNRVNTIYIAKLGSNGEPQLWHPSNTNPDNWEYWYDSQTLSGGTAKSYFAAVAYNNRMYIIGGQTNATPDGVTTVETADILPNGTLGSWTTTGMQALPSGAGRHMHSAHIYNDALYVIGGFEGAATSSANLRDSVFYSKLNNDGTMNTWHQTTSFSTARANFGGTFTAIWGAYIYIGGGCTAVDSNGYCTTIASDTQIASLNADGTVSDWGLMGGLDNTRIGYTFVAWQGGLYRLGGCTEQDSTSGVCASTLADVDYGVINPPGEVSTVNVSSASGAGDCTGGSPHSCDLPPPGDDAGEAGQMLQMSTILNGYLYVIGGCIDYDCNGTSPAGDDADVTGNIAYVSIDSSGRLTAPPSCAGTSYGAWCVDSTNKVNDTGSNTTDGVAAAGVATFNNRIYIVGGLTGNDGSTNIYFNTIDPSNGSLSGAWNSVSFAAAGISGEVGYTYAYARANPSSAGSNPGNLFIFGGCGSMGAGAGCSSYRTEVYKCNIEADGDISGCSTSSQLQIDSTPGSGGTDGLGLHSGTVYANYIFLIGGYSDAEADKDDVLYAKFDNNNNVVAVTGSSWLESPNKLSIGRRRGFSFGYNGHIYSIGGFDASEGGVIPFIEWSKMNVSDGSIEAFETSNITINQRWGLTMAVSNGYAYVIGGCDNGSSPSGCNSFERIVQTFQLYNNDSGSVNNFTAQGDQTFADSTDRIGAASAIHNGYIYVAGGCTNIGCTSVTDNVQFAPLSASDGTVGTWASTTDSTLPAQRAWGKLEAAGGTLYYMGGQDATGDEKSEVYYGTPSSGDVSSWQTASNGLPQDRAQHGATVWNDRLYVVGGLDDSATATDTVYYSPQLSSGGDIGSAWSSSTAFSVARAGAAVTAYANNLYLFGGFDGTNYLSDTQFAQINADGTIDNWLFSTSLPGPLRDSTAVSANGYIYLVNGRSASTTCGPKVLITPVSANTTIASGNNPTGIGEWYETNVKYTGDRYGAAIAYDKGKIYTMGGGCSSLLSSDRHYYSTVKSQPQVAKYSRMIDTDTDVFPNSWLMNGIDNSIGARWSVSYRSMNDTDGTATDCGTADMSTWGQETNFGDVTLGKVETYSPLDGSGNNINCARYYYFFTSIDASKTFGYPEDVQRGPTITDLSLFFTSDPNKRLIHGKTFIGGEQQPLDTPCRVSGGGDEHENCPLP